jgi:hypothetical protein
MSSSQSQSPLKDFEEQQVKIQEDYSKKLEEVYREKKEQEKSERELRGTPNKWRKRFVHMQILDHLDPVSVHKNDELLAAEYIYNTLKKDNKMLKNNCLKAHEDWIDVVKRNEDLTDKNIKLVEQLDYLKKKVSEYEEDNFDYHEFVGGGKQTYSEWIESHSPK